MPLTMEDVLLARRRNVLSKTEQYTPSPIEQEDEEAQEYLKYLEDSYVPPAAQPSAGNVYRDKLIQEQETLRQELGDTPRYTTPLPLSNVASSALSTLGEQYLREAEIGRAQAPGLIGAGEAATTLATGTIGFGVGALDAIGEAYRNPQYPIPSVFASEYSPPPPDDPNYWKNFVKRAGDIAGEFTYAPRTEEGKAALGRVAPAFEALHWFSRRASEAPLARMLLTEDQRELLAYGHELLTMTAVGEIGAAGTRALGRNLLGRFEKAFTEASKEPRGGSNTQRVLELAEELSTKAQKSPEIAEKFNPERIASLKAKQQEQGFAEVDAGLAEMERVRIMERDPTLAPRLREQGQAVLDRLVENPDNVEYTNAAIAYMEKTRGFGDAPMERLRSRINEFVELEDPTLAPSERAPVEGYSPTIFHPSPTPAIRPSRKSRTQPSVAPEEAPMLAPSESIDIVPGIEQLRTAVQNGEVSRRVAEARTQSLRDWKNGETGPPEWLREEAIRGPEIAAVEDTLLETSGSPARGTPSRKSGEEKIQAIEASNAYATKESTVLRIQEALDKNIDISKEIFNAVPGAVQAEYAVQRYEFMRKLARKGMDESARRGLMEMVQDITQLFAFDVQGLGSNLFNVKLNHTQMMAAQRLAVDAIKEGKSLLDFMVQEKVDPVAQEIFKRYLEPIMTSIVPPSGVGPKNMPLDGKAMSGQDPVMERHITQDKLLGVPLYGNEMKTIQTANIRSDPQGVWGFGWETPGRTFKSFSQPLYDMVMPNYRQAVKDFTAEARGVQKDLQTLERALHYKDRKAITDAVEMGASAKLQGKHKQGYDLLSEGGSIIIDRLNETRNALGISSLPEVRNPLEFIRSIMAAKSDGVIVHLVKTDASHIQNIMNSYKAKKMEGTLTQKALRLDPEMNIFRQYSKFSTEALEQMHMSPLTHKLRDLVNYAHLDMQKMDGTQYRVSVENPGLQKTINEWSNFVDGMPIRPLTVFGKNVDPLLRKLNENLAWSMLSWNLRSAMSQPGAIVNTFYKAGFEHTIGAVADNFASVLGKSNARNEAIHGSKVISTRKNQSLYQDIGGDLSEGFVKDFLRTSKESGIALREGRPREVLGGAARLGLGVLEWADYETAVTSLMAFRRQGKAKGLKGEALDNFADDGLVTTQASGARGDITPLQRSALGRTLTQFGTFGLSDINFMITEVLKLSPQSSMKEVLGNIGRYIGISTMATGIYEALGIDSPLPNPIKEVYRSYNKGDNLLTAAFKASFEVVGPYTGIFGSLRMGQPVGGPLMGAAYDASRSALDRPGAKSILDPISKVAGVPGVGTVWKVLKGNPQQSALGRLISYDPNNKAQGGALSSGLSSGGGMKSGLK